MPSSHVHEAACQSQHVFLSGAVRASLGALHVVVRMSLLLLEQMISERVFLPALGVTQTGCR